MNLLELTFQRKKAKAEAQSLLDRAAAEARALTIAEQVCFDGLVARIQQFDEAIAQRESLRKMVG